MTTNATRIFKVATVLYLVVPSTVAWRVHSKIFEIERVLLQLQGAILDSNWYCSPRLDSEHVHTCIHLRWPPGTVSARSSSSYEKNRRSWMVSRWQKFVTLISVYSYMVATGQEMVREIKCFKGQEIVRECHFESGKIWVFERSPEKVKF